MDPDTLLPMAYSIKVLSLSLSLSLSHTRTHTRTHLQLVFINAGI
jgi:hypothetical protein